MITIKDIKLAIEQNNIQFFDSTNYPDIKNIIMMLQQSGNAPASKASPLLYACRYGRTEIVEILLQLGANVNCISQSGKSALYIATKNGFKKLVILLLEHKPLLTPNQRNPILLAKNKNNSEICDYLIAYLIRHESNVINIATLLKYMPCDKLIKCQNNIRIADQAAVNLIKGMYGFLPIEILYNIISQLYGEYAPTFHDFRLKSNALLKAMDSKKSKFFSPAYHTYQHSNRKTEDNNDLLPGMCHTPSGLN